MKHRLLDLCLLAHRERDRAFLRDLAVELAERDGWWRQLGSLLLAGVRERLARPRGGLRRLSAGVAFAALAVVAVGAAGLVGPAVGSGRNVEVEVVACAEGPAACGQKAAAGGSIGRFLSRTLPPGASGTLVAARDGDVACHGFGKANREAGVAAGCRTVYDVMSMTKQFTAAAILKLEMMGELEVGDAIGEHLGEVPADKRAITLHHLLTHTSGLVPALGGDYERLTREGLIARALESRLRSAPGGRYRYSNVGYSLLAAIVEKASGTSYEEFLHRHLFAPAGMNSTGYVLPDFKRRQVAVEYDARGRSQGRPFEHPWAEDGPYWNLRGNGGILSTARDMLRWHVALEGDVILDAEAKAKLFEPHVLEEPGGDTHYGYGWVIQDQGRLGRVAWHDGGNGWSFGVVARLLDDGALVFWATNRYENAARGWNLAKLAPELTRGVAVRLLRGG